MALRTPPQSVRKQTCRLWQPFDSEYHPACPGAIPQKVVKNHPPRPIHPVQRGPTLVGDISKRNHPRLEPVLYEH